MWEDGHINLIVVVLEGVKVDGEEVDFPDIEGGGEIEEDTSFFNPFQSILFLFSILVLSLVIFNLSIHSKYRFYYLCSCWIFC